MMFTIFLLYIFINALALASQSGLSNKCTECCCASNFLSWMFEEMARFLRCIKSIWVNTLIQILIDWFIDYYQGRLCTVLCIKIMSCYSTWYQKQTFPRILFVKVHNHWSHHTWSFKRHYLQSYTIGTLQMKLRKKFHLLQWLHIFADLVF